MPKYFAAHGSPFSDADAAIIGPELEALAKAGAGSTGDIVEAARDSDSPLRPYLHMDRPTEVVAESWYKYRARLVTGSIMLNVRVSGRTVPVRAFHSVVVTQQGGEKDGEPVRRYVTVKQVRESEPMAEQVMADALGHLREWTDRYAAYRAAFGASHPAVEGVFAAIEDALELENVT